jgi:hypothetical protein
MIAPISQHPPPNKGTQHSPWLDVATNSFIVSEKPSAEEKPSGSSAEDFVTTVKELKSSMPPSTTHISPQSGELQQDIHRAEAPSQSLIYEYFPLDFDSSRMSNHMC